MIGGYYLELGTRNPIKEKIEQPSPVAGPPAFDLAAIEEYCEFRHRLAAGLDGKFVVKAFTTEQKSRCRWIGHFNVGDAKRMSRAIAAFCPATGRRGDEHLNLYCQWAVFDPNIPVAGKGSGGRMKDVIASFAAVSDYDNDKREGKALPFEPTCRLETSPGNFQEFFIFPQPILLAQAKVTLAALNRMTGNEPCEKNPAHIWRIVGTLNWPNKAKLDRGRSPIPWLVRWASFTDLRVDPEAIISAAPPEPVKVRNLEPPAELSDFEVAKLVSALTVLHPDRLPTVEPPRDPYDFWLWVLMGVHSLQWGDVGLDIADKWSQRSRYYDVEELETKWDSFDTGENQRGVGSIFMWAKGECWEMPVADWPEPDPDWPEPDPAESGPEPIPDWPEPRPIGDGLLPVLPFSPDFLPPAIKDWVIDIADRKQCPIEYAAIPAIVALGVVIGGKIAVRPKQLDSWTENPNFWGMVIGRPGMLKSPASDDVLKPIHGLEREARTAFAEAMRGYEEQVEQWEVLRRNDRTANTSLAGPKPEKPVQKRYLTSDTTYEKLGVMMQGNPDGILVHRDELISLLKHLDKEEQCNARSFYMTAWNGSSSYTFDRIERGIVHIERVCLSIVGAATPSTIAKYIKDIEVAGAGGDGLFQRFGLAVWPDITPDWHNSDHRPDIEARDRAYNLFKRLDTLQPMSIGAEFDSWDKTPFLRLDLDAEATFLVWRGKLERQLRADGKIGPMLEAHISKYRKLVPILALINHLADEAATGPISDSAMERALRFIEYLESHARRIYASGKANKVDVAKAILDRIEHRYLLEGFKPRDVIQGHWSGLRETDAIMEGLELLCELGWLRSETVKPQFGPGRPSTIYHVSPACFRSG